MRAIADLYGLPQSPTELSVIARQGSGSACRSLLGGYVAWDAGTEVDGSDSKAREVAPVEHWPEMRALILVVSAEKKGVSSTSGMQATVATSSLFKMRAETVVPERMKVMEGAVRERDFESFAKVTMRESNSFHACCLDTEPPIFYLNDVSKAAIRTVEVINERAERVIAAHTFDAGPNAVVYFLEKDKLFVTSTFRAILGDKEGWREPAMSSTNLDGTIRELKTVGEMLARGVSRVIETQIGRGPVSVQEHLIDEAGNPVASS